MARRRNYITALLSACGMIILILDSKTAVAGATEGIEMCLRTVIPSLLPFFVLSIMLTSTASGINIPFLRGLGTVCGIPKGSEHILLVGLLGGYPVGAQTVTQAYHSGHLTKQDAHRMLGFCSNAGPSFFFGLAGSLFSSKTTVLLLWFIHILSAMIVAAIIPGKTRRKCELNSRTPVTLPDALWKAMRIMAGVCGWILVFRILIAFIDHWFIWMLPESVRIVTTGLLEAANGCIRLLQVQSELIRYIICSVILGFGGICVGMQTVYVTGELGTGWYFPGKILQTLFSFVLSSITAYYLFIRKYDPIALIAIVSLLLLCILCICKKIVAFLSNRVYNNTKQERNLYTCCFEKK